MDSRTHNGSSGGRGQAMVSAAPMASALLTSDSGTAAQEAAARVDDPLARLSIVPAYNTWLESIFGARTPQQRLASGRRVILLIGAMALMGIVDLMLTMIYMRSTGMYEANPIARTLASLGAGEHLIAFKLVTMFVSGAALYLGRHSRRGEFAAWVCAALLVVLMFHWANYAREAAQLTNELFLLAEFGDDLSNSSWVRIASQ